MALGGGTFVAQNKELPGAYINFVSASAANAALSDRGIVTMPLELDWGVEGKMFEVTGGEFQKNSMAIFGYEYTSDKLKGLRDLFLNAQTLYGYRLNGGGKKAGNALAEALYSGVRGNDLKIVVQVNADDESLFDVKTILGSSVVDEQTVSKADELTVNAFVKWKSGITLEAAASIPLTGGENGEASGADHQAYLDQAESYSFHTMGVVVTDDTTKALYAACNKRLRDEMGVKFQLVLYDYAKADYMGVISVNNKVLDSECNEASLVYWVTGASAGCAVNKSNQNKKYDGCFMVETPYTQNQLKEAIRAGKYTFHRVGTEIRVLEDINTMVTTSDTRGDIFKDNQTIRVIDQIGNDIAVLFNTKYLGIVPNDAAGRISLWSDIVAYYRQLEQIQAIEDFSDSGVTVEPGDTKKSVTVSSEVNVVNAMGKLYMTVTVS
ncbi:phage tail sheath family protein [Acetatifactor muris]|uniref:phage tail sheath family protein n=1 Tax=Acetatifactor muris TaxID=879566 RepID=UPI0023EFAC64|nr:phage tail sheath family protein [Acetatifactor muris]